MLIQPIDIFVFAWLIVAVLSAAYVAWDQFHGNPEPVVMKWGFVLVTLYMGPVGFLLYVMADKEPAPGMHEEFVKPLWKQSVGSTVHCIAGDATGIILAAAATALLGLPMWIDVIVEYAFGFLFGLLIFQSLFMRSMMGGSYAENVRRSFLPELLSMNMMMAGMAPVMILLMMSRDMRAMWPGEREPHRIVQRVDRHGARRSLTHENPLAGIRLHRRARPSRLRACARQARKCPGSIHTRGTTPPPCQRP